MKGNIVALSSTFIWRRIHSLAGFGLILFLCEHLWVNAQAALWIGNDGHGFVRLVNALQAIPGLRLIEIALIGIPLFVHILWGVQRIWCAKMNSWPNSGASPSLPFACNQAFTWQRLSAWVLIVAIGCHVVDMRFVRHPRMIRDEQNEMAAVKLSVDEGLPVLTKRLGVRLLSSDEIVQLQPEDPKKAALASFRLRPMDVVAMAPDPGTAVLLSVRDSMKCPAVCLLYSIFVLLAAFHAGNGFWTFLLTWGFIISAGAQTAYRILGIVGIVALGLLGLSAVWLTYFVSLRH
jgi:succinate dehydrogenase / fumarate reductase cytochrome b subunit